MPFTEHDMAALQAATTFDPARYAAAMADHGRPDEVTCDACDELVPVSSRGAVPRYCLSCRLLRRQQRRQARRIVARRARTRGQTAPDV